MTTHIIGTLAFYDRVVEFGTTWRVVLYTLSQKTGPLRIMRYNYIKIIHNVY